jgi:tetratricopeptide (TPR) repeat protein
MNAIRTAALLILACVPAAAEDYGQLHDAIKYCQPKNADDPNLVISSCLKALDSNLIDRSARAQAWINVAGAHLELKQYPDAFNAADNAIEADPNKWRAYANRAIAEAELGKPADAETDLDKAIDMAPNEPGPVLTRGQLYLAEGKLDQAIADFSTVIEKDSSTAPAYGLRAVAYAKQGKADLAAADRAQYSKLDPEDKYGLLKQR